MLPLRIGFRLRVEVWSDRAAPSGRFEGMAATAGAREKDRLPLRRVAGCRFRLCRSRDACSRDARGRRRSGDSDGPRHGSTARAGMSDCPADYPAGTSNAKNRSQTKTSPTVTAGSRFRSAATAERYRLVPARVRAETIGLLAAMIPIQATGSGTRSSINSSISAMSGNAATVGVTAGCAGGGRSSQRTPGAEKTVASSARAQIKGHIHRVCRLRLFTTIKSRLPRVEKIEFARCQRGTPMGKRVSASSEIHADQSRSSSSRPG